MKIQHEIAQLQTDALPGQLLDVMHRINAIYLKNSWGKRTHTGTAWVGLQHIILALDLQWRQWDRALIRQALAALVRDGSLRQHPDVKHQNHYALAA